MTALHKPLAFYILFGISGFSGLIYESIWTGYLKLLLGHAAYAQTAVLAIFMGGMALGAAAVARLTGRFRQPLVAYAVVEGLIGLGAIVFHPFFIKIQGIVFQGWMPGLSPLSADLLKWSVACLLILPQSILLGMTFPLMSAAVVRLFPAAPGRVLATLYFTNSLGAALGVLWAGFYLIELVGLPGSILTAGLMNVAVAILAWAASKLMKPEGETRGEQNHRSAAASEGWLSYRLLLLVALGTGTASFIYEITWIRMLSMVLGSSTHAFELMLSAFILGLALGGWWVRKRADHFGNPRLALVVIQIAMGMLAISTLFVYGYAFDAMGYMLKVLQRTSEGHRWFLITSHGLALLVMLPATICAGMTLPLITMILFRGSQGEKAIGKVYAFNTLGSILGVIIAVHLLLPQVGVHGALVIGGGLDVALGLMLLVSAPSQLYHRLGAAASGLGVILVGTIYGAPQPARMASGVFRTGEAVLPDTHRIMMHRDGKTASVTLLEKEKLRIISTNGKPDGSMQLDSAVAAPDEPTQVLAGGIPLALKPTARRAAVIGFGTGATSQVLLTSPELEHLDIIEIEKAMIELAWVGFGERIRSTKEDPRAHIRIDDAKSFFASHGGLYDIIVSEPSNPWVSGVASLFTDEFYATSRRHLKPDGILLQWVQGYETDMMILASIMKALGKNYSDYAIFLPSNSDMLIVAVPSGKLPPLSDRLYSWTDTKWEMKRLGVRDLGDLRQRVLGTRRILEPLFQASSTPMNSDYFPIVDIHASKQRYLGQSLRDFTGLIVTALPVQEMLDGISVPLPSDRDRSLENIPAFPRNERQAEAWHIHDVITKKRTPNTLALPLAALAQLATTGEACKPLSDDNVVVLLDLAERTLSLLPIEAANRLLQEIKKTGCWSSGLPSAWMRLMEGVANRDAVGMSAAVDRLLPVTPQNHVNSMRYLLKTGLLACAALKDPKRAQDLIAKYGTEFGKINYAVDAELRWLQRINAATMSATETR